MSSLSSIQHQCRSFESIYLFKVRSEGNLSIKILDLSQRCLFKRTFSPQDLSHLSVEQLLIKGNFTFILERLVENHLLPREHLIPIRKEVTQETCEEAFQETIEQFKPKIFVEGREIERFTCPLTLEIFREPVIDEHGHTFEKSVIEEHLRSMNECPISREPIHSLVPNRLVQQAIEDWQQLDPIPNFSLFQRENPQLAEVNLQMAQTYVNEKEYREALDFYAKAFQYTRNWVDYRPLPFLFETMEDYEKATLAYLYLAKYQLQTGNLPEAIQTLEICQRGNSAHLQNNLVLVELYYFTGQLEKALELAIQTAETFSKQNPEQALAIYKRILRDHPSRFSLYSSLASLLENPQEKTQVLLKGALEALQEGDYTAAERLTQEAESYSEDSFVDQLVFLELIKKQRQDPLLKQKLLQLARAFERKELTHQMLSAYKMLFQLERNSEYCHKILTAYRVLKKSQKEFEWSLTYLSLLIETKEWEQAEALARQVLQKTQTPQQKIFLYESLEVVYTYWNGHELQDLWGKLGKAYRDTGQLAAAERTYQQAFERFHRFEDAISLAEVFRESGRIQESVHIYYEEAVAALLEQNIGKLSLCTRGIKEVDPHMEQLDLNQKMHLLAQEHILRLSDELQKANQKIELLREKALQEERRRLVEEQEIARLEEIARQRREVLSQVCFDKADWERYFGTMREQPSLPEDIWEILRSPCPFWEGRRVEDTHMLVLIPKTVNGIPLTLNSLRGLIQRPLEGGHNTEYYSYPKHIRDNIAGNQEVSQSYWVLMTKDVLPNSRNKIFREQQALLRNSYDVPGVLEAATAILMYHAKWGEQLYPDNPRIYTRCQETLLSCNRIAIGSFGSSGLHICFYGGTYGCSGLRQGYDYHGLSGVRRFRNAPRD